MTDDDRRELLSDLLGELPEDRRTRLATRLRAEPELARAREELAHRWQALELPPAATAPLGFAARVRRAAEREERANPFGFGTGLLPTAVASGLLAGGVALGLWLGAGLAPPTGTPVTAEVVGPAPVPAVAVPAPVEPVAEPPALETAATPPPAEERIARAEPADETLGSDAELGFAGDSFADAYVALLAEDVAQ